MNLPPVHYVTTADSVNLAYTVTGRGRPLVMLPLGLNHVQLSWRYDRRITGWLEALASRFRLVRYDGRGQGMSSRGLQPGHGMDDYYVDLETMIQHLEIERFILLGYVWFSHVAVRYAAEHPERVDALILVSPSVTGGAWPMEAQIGMVAFSWDIFLRNFVPDGSSREDAERTVGYFRQTATPSDYKVHMGTFAASDVSGALPRLRVPTLVIHPRDFLWVAMEEVERVAALIPDARLVVIDGNMAFGEVGQAMPVIDDFLAGLSAAAVDKDELVALLSHRELDVLALVAQGLTNQQIADRLVISVNTVARHVASILSKTGARNRTEAALWAGKHHSTAQG